MRLNTPLFRRAAICCAVNFLIMSGSAFAELKFDPSMISGDVESVADLSHFKSAGSQLPGSYTVDIILNGVIFDSRTIRFVAIDTQRTNAGTAIRDATGLMACLTVDDLKSMGVNTAAFSTLAAVQPSSCVSPGEAIPQAYTSFNFEKMQLNISIPQAAMFNQARDWIPPEQWDEGINAALMSWRLSGSENRGTYGNSRSQYLNVTSGFNLGAWRLRDNSIWTHYENRYSQKQQWQHLSTYLQRAIIPWRSELTLGDSNSGAEVFNPLPFRGVQLATDESMYPETLRGFAPTIKGTANNNAEVSIRQNGNVIYRTWVAPGAFAINDLYPLSSGGDLEVTIVEANGASTVFSVPYSSVPVLQRQGYVRYGLIAGHYRSTSDRYSDPAFTQGTLLWGLPHNLTTYGGVQLASDYQAFALGAGINMGSWGALSADITQASSVLADGSHHTGQSTRLQYGRSLLTTGTTFKLAGYRFSTQGFHTLDEVALKGMSGWLDDRDTVDAAGRLNERNRNSYYNLYNNKRDRLQVNVSQRLGDSGSLYLTGSRQTYWNDRSASNALQAGFSSGLGGVNYNLSYSYSQYSGQSGADRSLFLSLSFPLDGWLTSGGKTAQSRTTWANYITSRDTDGHVTHLAGLSGVGLDRGNLNWSVSQGYARRDGASGDASLGYQGTYGTTSAGYGYSQRFQQFRYGASGSMLLHGNGVTFGQPLSTTNVLVAAPGATGVPVENGTGVQTDWRGYTIVPYASMYRENRVALDVSQLNNNTDIENAVARVIPTRGAIVRADFHAKTGVRALMKLTNKGKPLPFGATVSAVDDSSSSLVGDGGQVYLSGLASQGELKAQWGSRPDQKCTVRYTLSENALKASLARGSAICE